MVPDIPILIIELAGNHPGTGDPYDVDAVIATGQLNAVNREVNKSAMSGDELFAATDETQFVGLSGHKQSAWLAFCGRESIDPFGAANVALVTWVFGTGSATFVTLAEIRKTSVSRAVELGLGLIKPGHVEEARYQ